MDRYRIKPGTRVDLNEWDPKDTGAFDGKKSDATAELAKLTRHLEDLQEVLYAEHKHKILIVLQGMDTAGKDGTIRHVFEGVNPQGVRVTSFKVPTPEELDHDFLWRIHKQVPAKGEIAIFNRSHYEDVLVVRVRNLVPPEVWRKRYSAINEFERTLVGEGTSILKFFLHIGKNEQKERLQARLDDPVKRWKFQLGDLKERTLWPDYMKAYEDALSETSTHHAPWYVVPANKKWYRNYVVASVIVETLRNLNMKYPEADPALKGVVVE